MNGEVRGMTQPDDDSSEDEGEHVWPEVMLSAAEARAWIATVLPGSPEVFGPIEIFQAKGWGVTASFAAAGAATTPGGARRGEEVIFKASALPLFSAAPRMAEMLARHAPGDVPDVIAWQRHGAQTWTLFRPFEGQSLEKLRALEPLLELARTLAHIQMAVAAAPAAGKEGLPRTPVERLPALFEVVARDVRERQAAYWEETEQGRQMADQFALPADVAARVEAMRPHVARWTVELAADSWPETVDHVDLHWSNAVVRPDGGVLIFDWEEAVLSLPFFSLDRLLNDARELDLGEDAAWRAHPDAPLYTPAERALRGAYLDALAWGGRTARERAFELAMALAPVKTAYEAMEYAQALGYRQGAPFATAWALGRALPRWTALTGNR
jgi:hypothetical protein